VTGTFRKIIYHTRRAALIQMYSFIQLLCIRVHIFQGFAYNPVLCIKRAFQSCVGLPENLRYKMPGTFRKLIFHSRRAAFIKMCSFLQLLCIREYIFQGFAFNPVLF
jgi:hypothetical protein